MADNITDTPVVETSQPTVSPEIAQMMAISLNNGIVPQQTTEVSENLGSQETGAEPVIVEGSKPEVTITHDTNVVSNPFDILKEKFQYASAEDAIREIEELRGFKTNPTKEELKFANDEMKRIYEYISEGKEDEVAKYVAGRQLIKDIDSKTPEEKLKLQIQLQNPLFDKELIEDEYKSLYTIDEKSPKVLDEYGEIDPTKLKKETLRLQQRIANDVEQAAETFNKFKSKIELPPLTKQVDEDYVSFKEQQELAAKAAQEAVEVYSKLTPESIETVINFNDEANKIKFDFSYKPDLDSFNQAKEMVSDTDKFWSQFRNQDGSPNREKFFTFVYKGMAADKMIKEAMNQTKNATIKAQLPNNSGRENRQIPQNQQMSDLDKMMQYSLAGYMNK